MYLIKFITMRLNTSGFDICVNMRNVVCLYILWNLYTGSQSLPIYLPTIQYERAFSRRTIIIIIITKVQVYSDAVPILIVFLNKQQTCRKPIHWRVFASTNVLCTEHTTKQIINIYCSSNTVIVKV